MILRLLLNLLFHSGNPFSVIILLLQLFLTTAFIPYQVSRPERRKPIFTYGLIAVNVFVFLATVFIANINLPADRIEGKTAINEILEKDRAKLPAGLAATLTAMDQNKPPEGMSEREQKFIADQIQQQRKQAALYVAYNQADSAEGYKRVWQIQNSDSGFVMEPHYSVQNLFAYRAGEPVFWRKLLGLFGSMFLHGGLLHLAGNMLYLWVFGRALEEDHGPAVFLGAYLLCGVAATLMYHIMVMQFTPQSAAVPLVGASGAIAGVLGLFALRFYRTPVSIFYIQPLSLAIVFGVATVVAAISAVLLGIIGAIVGFLAVWVGFILYMRKAAIGTFKMPSAWMLGIWVVAFNLLPGVASLLSDVKQGGTAYWAHIGGFLFGMLYAMLIGSKHEGAKEYMLADAQKQLDSGTLEDAIAFAQNLLEREPNNAGAYEVLGKAYEGLNDEDKALDNYELAVSHYVRSGLRDEAARVYLHALEKFEGFILPPDMQLAVGNQLAKSGDFLRAAETLVKIPYTFPEAHESELSLLRSAQIYLEQLSQPEMCLTLLQEFLQRYPHTQWMPQVQRAWKVATFQLNPPPPEEVAEAAPVEPVPPPPAPSQRAQAGAPPRPPGQ